MSSETPFSSPQQSAATAPVRMPVSQAIFKRLLRLSVVLTLVLALVAAVLGWVFDSHLGLRGAVLGALLGGAFMMISGLSIVIANRQIANPLYVQIFFGTVLGALLVKMVAFLVVVFLVKDSTWLNPQALFIALIAGVVLSLALDLVVLLRSKIPAASDVQLFE